MVVDRYDSVDVAPVILDGVVKILNLGRAGVAVDDYEAPVLVRARVSPQDLVVGDAGVAWVVQSSLT